MAEDTPTASAPAGEPAPAERAPDTETKSAAAAESAPETSQEKGSEKVNESEKEKPSDKEGATENKEKPASDTPAAEGAADAKKPEEGVAASDSAEVKAAPQTDANGTPSSSKKGGSAKRKSSGGIPEHKSKQNRRKSHVNQVHAKPGEYYLARLRSFPPWPSIICDEEILPQSLIDTRPVSAYRPDGTIRDDYAEGGKRAHERTYPVMFFQTNEFAWVQNTCLSPTDPESCKNVSEKSKSKLLLQAYAVAAEGNDLEHFKKLLSDHEHALEQEIAAQEAAEKAAAEKAEKAAAEKAEKAAKKNKRKSMDIADDGADDIEMGEAEGSKKSKSTKKRKKDQDDEADKPSKTPKTGTKLKLTTPKTPASEGGKKSGGSSKSKQPASGKKGDKTATSEEDEEDTGAEAKAPKKQMSQQEAKVKREKEILFIRHRLQKGFISRDQPPKEDEMTQMSGYFARLEAHKDLEVAIIRQTKINKVLKMIVKLNAIPRDEEFQFRKRAMDMLSQWKNDLELDTTITPGDDKDDKADGKEKEVQPKANGDHKEDGIDTPTRGVTEEDKAKEDTNEPLDEPMTDADAEKPKSSDENAAPKEGEEKAEEETVKAPKSTEEKGKPAEKEEAEKPATEGKEAEKAEEKTEAAA